MKILLATHWLIPHVGGVWNFMVQLKQHLENHGHQVDMMGNSPDYKKIHIVNQHGMELAKEALLPILSAKLASAQVPELNAHPVITNYELERYFMELSAAYFGLESYDIIHTQDVFATRSLSRVKPKRTPLIAHVHGSVAREMMDHFRNHPEMGISEGSPAWRYFPSMEYHAAMATDITIAANQWSKNILVGEFGVPENRVAVFQYGFDAPAFYAKMNAGTPVVRPPGKKVIICPARLVYVKGIHVLISALEILRHMRDDWVCWIVGDGDYRGQLELQTVNSSLQYHVFFHGSRNDVPAMLTQSDIFVHTCIQDNQPYSVMEAQMAGLPCIVSSAGGLPEMVQHGQTGLISPVGDAYTVAQQLNLLLERDDYRMRLGQNAKAFAMNHWSMDLMVQRMLMMYHGALTQR
ncbi:glycosyltransferase family 4 protein [Paenibacillus campinasensis]|uniref:Glycosyl transferase n=1 Tax=Paenibacillus campinasensis TaxID=66347 RepID=A0A268EN21_9BACL|nr:glycosyltransferase family 4 protein [Paenibacillus campinasensis]MUG65796.1 glycosyltransferase [Paenibacillus campinasensis]PAD74512.1 glycosyl transferase [Paenibacillus campinasensis]